MGHDISAFIKTKANPNPLEADNWSDHEAAYFRINAFNTTRQRLFYGTLRGAAAANGGVSGNGRTIDFTRDDIVNAINACKYYLDDDDDAQDFVDATVFDAERDGEMVKRVMEQALGVKMGEMESEIRENIADIWKFHEDILSEYDDAMKNDDSAQIQIYFG